MSPLTPHPSPRISVVIPTFNDAGRIRDALESIAAQTLRPVEIVVSDDASTDNTEAVVSAFAAEHPALAVRYLRNGARSGVVATRNRGIRSATGQWIANCDSDDWWAPVKLERQADFVRVWRGDESIALLGTHGFNTNDRLRVISPAVMGPTNETEYRDLRRTGGIYFCIHSSVLFAKNDFEAVGGYSAEYGAADDLHFFCEMAKRGVVVNVPERLTYYRKRTGSVQTASFWDQRRGLDRLAENEKRRARGEQPLDPDSFAHVAAASPVRERFSRWRRNWGTYYYRRGAVAYANGRPVSALVHLVPAAVLDGRRLRAGLAGVVSHRARRLAGKA